MGIGIAWLRASRGASRSPVSIDVSQGLSGGVCVKAPTQLARVHPSRERLETTFTAWTQLRSIASAPMRWLMVSGLAAVVLCAITWDARRAEYGTRRAWAVVAVVLAGTVILAVAVMSRWAFGADVY